MNSTPFFDAAFIAACDEEFDAAPTKATNPEFARQQFTCEACNGTGMWRNGRTNYRGNAKCNACNGRGHFVTDPRTRAKARQATASRKQRVADESRAANAAHGDGSLLAALQGMAEWNDFARSLVDQHNAGRAWSAKQTAAAERMVAKVEATRAAKAAAKAAAATSVDLSPIVAMFATALDSGYKKPMYRALGLRIKPGKGGALYVMTEDRMELGHFGEQPGYEGKIADGAFHPVRATAKDTPAKLQAIAADPRGEAVRYGQRTGTCSCCGRELTKHASIEAGIGPICAEKWGLA